METVPYNMPLPNGVYDKMLITIHAEPQPDAKKFSINLLRNEDIAFHFNPRFEEDGINVLVRNSMINSEWGAEERTAPSFPFIHGQPFEVKILCTPDEYKVAVNNENLFEYKHRVFELNEINALTIHDDVILTSVNVETLHIMELSDALESAAAPSDQSNLQAGGPAWPGQPQNPAWPGQPSGQPFQTWPGQQPGMPAWPNQPNQPAWPAQPSQPFNPGWPGQAPQTVALTVPYKMPLPLGVYDKMLITVQGNPKPDAKKFSINLLRNEDIALHFNPRFDENGIKVVVRNSMVNNVWGAEERTAPSFPFIRGQPFEVKILCTPNDYKVAVNKAHLLEYKHRVFELKQINYLTILDDVILTSVNVETLP
ncbi:galectin-3b [Tachysurus fulvidraco]|uniref:galectin-3b n=1 Tax=Tachysurus fulvidraco TaxID=1234273 RepID=UPI001FED84AA|nr:galectin-3b [Tachysurus fulvidraco]